MDALTRVWSIRTPYLTKSAANGLLKYKYSGKDESLLYIYFWSPVAELLTPFVPPWVAYNINIDSP